MKKLLAILLIMIYGISSTGATVQLHYCCGKLKSVKLSTAPVKDCGNKHKMGSKPCCETKEVKAKSQEQQEVMTLLSAKAPVEARAFFITSLNQQIVEAEFHQQADYDSPPLSRSLFVLNCVFRV